LPILLIVGETVLSNVVFGKGVEGDKEEREVMKAMVAG
jgi:hypothetical protein